MAFLLEFIKKIQRVLDTLSGSGGMIKESYPTLKLDIRWLRGIYQHLNSLIMFFLTFLKKGLFMKPKKPVNYRDSDTGRYLSKQDALSRDQKTVEKEQRKPARSRK